MPISATLKTHPLASALALCLAGGLALVFFVSRNSDGEVAEKSAPAKPSLSALQTQRHEPDTGVDATYDKLAQQAQAKRDAGNAIESAPQEALEAQQRQQLEDRALRLEDQTNSRVIALGERLGLSEAQRDQVFQILVKNSRAYDSQMSTAGEADSPMAELPQKVIDTLEKSGVGITLDEGTITQVNRDWGFAVIDTGSKKLPASEAVADPAEPATETPPSESLIKDLTPAEITKFVEAEAIQEVLEPEQVDKYGTLLDEIDGYWGDLVTEVTKEIEAEEATAASAAAASTAAPKTTRQK